MADFMKVDSARLQQAEGRASHSERTGAPSSSDVTAFEQALERTEERGGRGNQQEGGQGSQGESRESFQKGSSEGDPDLQNPFAAFSGMSNPLDALFGKQSVAAPEATTPQDPSDLAEKLVDRILVAESETQGSEIRLRLGNDVLPGTEIRLQRHPDGSLAITLCTDNANSFQTLVAAQQSLKAQLEGFEKQEVRVEVTSESEDTQAENGDSQRRSRGLWQQNSQTQE